MIVRSRLPLALTLLTGTALATPAFAGESETDRVLRTAACHLSDISWDDHPDYRAELCFESVTRANISGIDHPERVYLGLALYNRYKASVGGPGGTEATRYAALLSPEQTDAATSLGRALRLGAMLSCAARPAPSPVRRWSAACRRSPSASTSPTRSIWRNRVDAVGGESKPPLAPTIETRQPLLGESSNGRQGPGAAHAGIRRPVKRKSGLPCADRLSIGFPPRLGPARIDRFKGLR